jgi:hypothetical protein
MASHDDPTLGFGTRAVDREGAFPPPLSRQSRDIHPSARRVARHLS